MALTEGEGPATFSYIGSSLVVSSALFDSSSIAVVFALLLFKIKTITVIKTTAQTTKVIATELNDIIYPVLVAALCHPTVSVVPELYMLWFSVRFTSRMPVGGALVGSVA